MQRIVMIAHDAKKRDMIEWVRFNREALRISSPLYRERGVAGEAAL